ncbi:hypothetical protein ABPG73_010170 [Tetrahymena malaccensis]
MIKDQQQSNLSQDQNKFQQIQNNETQNSLIQANQDFNAVQELQITQDYKQADWRNNIMLNSSDLTLKKSLKSQVAKLAHNKMLTNVLCKIINQKNEQIVQIIYQKNAQKSPELDLQGHLYQINQKYLDQKQEECIILSTGSQKSHTGQREDKEDIQQNNQSQSIKFNQILFILIQQNHQHILEEIQAYQFKDYEQQDQTEAQSQIGYLIERKFNEDTFNSVNNKSSFKNKHFEQMKREIFIKLEEKNYYLCKLLNSNDKQDMFIGYEEQDECQYEDELIQIKYNMTQQELKITQQTFEALQLEYEEIDIQSHNTYVFVLSKKDIENLQSNLKNFNQVLDEIFNILKFKKHFEITFKNENKQQNSEKEIDFLFSFLKNQKYYLCEFNDQQIEGIMLKADHQQIIQSFQDYINLQIYNISLKDDDFTQQDFRQSKDIAEEKEVSSDKTQARPENINLQESILNQNINYEQIQNQYLDDQNNQVQFKNQQTIIENLENQQSTEDLKKNDIFINQANKLKCIQSEEIILKQQDSSQQSKDSYIKNNSINMNQENINLEQFKDFIQMLQRPLENINQEQQPNKQLNHLYNFIQSQQQNTSIDNLVILKEKKNQEKDLIFKNQTDKLKDSIQEENILKQQEVQQQDKDGYTYCKVPRKHEYQEIIVKAWTPAQSIYQKIHEFFLGGQTKLYDIKKIAQNSIVNEENIQSAIDRFNLTTESKGAVKLIFNVAFKKNVVKHIYLIKKFVQIRKSKEEQIAIYDEKRSNLKKQQQKIIDQSEIDYQGQQDNSYAPVKSNINFQTNIQYANKQLKLKRNEHQIPLRYTTKKLN